MVPRSRTYIYIYNYIHTHIYIYIYMCVCVFWVQVQGFEQLCVACLELRATRIGQA